MIPNMTLSNREEIGFFSPYMDKVNRKSGCYVCIMMFFNVNCLFFFIIPENITPRAHEKKIVIDYIYNILYCLDYK